MKTKYNCEDYISRDYLLNEYDRQHKGPPGGARKIIVEAPAADVAEVLHGRWIKDDQTGEPICSVCYSGKPTRAVCSPVIEHKLNNYEIRYCYYCGAKMDGGQDDASNT